MLSEKQRDISLQSDSHDFELNMELRNMPLISDFHVSQASSCFGISTHQISLLETQSITPEVTRNYEFTFEGNEIQSNDNVSIKRKHSSHGHPVKKKSLNTPLYSNFLSHSTDAMAHFPNEYFSAINVGDINSLKYMTNGIFHTKCVFRKTDVNYVHRTGRDTMIQYFSAVLNSLPDSVFQITKIKLKFSKGLILIKCQISYSGTLVAKKYFDEFYGGKDEDLLSLMEMEKLTANEISSLQERQDFIKNMGQAMNLTGITKTNFYYNSSIGKIVGYDECFILKTFNGIDVKNIDPSLIKSS